MDSNILKRIFLNRKQSSGGFLLNSFGAPSFHTNVLPVRISSASETRDTNYSYGCSIMKFNRKKYKIKLTLLRSKNAALIWWFS